MDRDLTRIRVEANTTNFGWPAVTAVEDGLTLARVGGGVRDAAAARAVARRIAALWNLHVGWPIERLEADLHTLAETRAAADARAAREEPTRSAADDGFVRYAERPLETR